ncbi:hypothetical protein B0H13DRAFT_2310570 [Mycena leptocephala]|nr:hypothetical protein B0H13DRAFT_2310570 [Mycena leptocephala]
MAPPSDDGLPASIALPTRSTRSTKRKSDVASDGSDADVVPPRKKKPKAKKKSPDVEYSEAESEPKPARKKPGPKLKPKVAAKSMPCSSSERVRECLGTK